jgi:hypothetical protein
MDNENANVIKRKKRFVRDRSVNIQITERDIDIMKLVFKHRYMTSDQIIALAGKSRKTILRRLYLLFHAGFLDRPKAQIQAYGNNAPMIYGLGSRGGEVMAKEYNEPSISKINWTEKNKNSKSMFLEHTLMVSEFLTAIRLACRKVEGLDFIDAEQIVNNRPVPAPDKSDPLSWKVTGKTNRKFSFSIIPDGAFGLRINQDGKENVVYYFIETDRATMPVVRHNLIRSSIYKKMLGYTTSMSDKLYGKNFGFKKVFILMITQSDERIGNMVKLNKDIHPKGIGYRLFKFTDSRMVNLERPETLLGFSWMNGQGEQSNIIN